MANYKVAILMGSDSDFPQLEGCVKVLKSFGVECEARVMSAHRTPAIAMEFASNARENGFGVVIAAAGKAAHLAGVVAAHTTLPVIGVPIKSSTLDGLDALLATVQMPTGIPVATVAIGGGDNAGLLAVEMLGISDSEIAKKLAKYKEDMVTKVKAKDEKVRALAKEIQ